MTEKEKLIDRLFGNPNIKVKNFKITPGDKTLRGEVTEEELCAEINKALDNIAAPITGTAGGPAIVGNSNITINITNASGNIQGGNDDLKED